MNLGQSALKIKRKLRYPSKPTTTTASAIGYEKYQRLLDQLKGRGKFMDYGKFHRD